MEVIKNVFLELNEKKVTVFHIVPISTEAEKAKFLLEQAVEEYEKSLNYNTARFIKKSSEFEIIIVEGQYLQ